MISVFIWNYRGKSEAWGHASMQVDHTCISWWPAQPGQVPSKIHRNLYASHPFRNRSFADDIEAEEQRPDYVVQLTGLDEEAVHRWWSGLGLHDKGADLQGPLQAWKTLERNCSTVVAAGLKAGGADQYASKWNAYFDSELATPAPCAAGAPSFAWRPCSASNRPEAVNSLDAARHGILRHASRYALTAPDGASKGHTMHSRRAFVATSALALAAAPAAARAKAILTRIDGGLSPYFPTQDAEEVRSIVGASHTDIDAVREFVTRRPDLSKAAWDWGFGDWESALGAASHMGRPDIAELLIASGARPDIFTFAMLNQVDALRAICQANPGIQRLLGPHGTFTLMRHAKMRNGDAADVEAYLAELGDADVPQPDLGLPEPDSRPFLGEYTPEGAPGVVFKIAYRDRQRVLSLQRDDQAVRNLFNQGGGVFCPAGAPAVRIRFDTSAAPYASFLIEDGDLRLQATRRA